MAAVFPAIRTCVECDQTFTQTEGRPRNFCSQACRTVAYSAKRAAEREGNRSRKVCHKCGEESRPGLTLCLRCQTTQASCQRASRRRLRAEVLAVYGGKCTCCGETRFEFLAFDHIDGGGNQHRKEQRLIGHAFTVWLKKNNYPPGFQIHCHNCNVAKGMYGVCPHQSEK